MLTFEQIKEHYEKGYWSAAMVQRAVDKGIITAEQAKEIISPV